MAAENIEEQLSKYTYVVFYEETDPSIKKLVMFTDDNSILIDIGTDERLKEFVLSTYHPKEIPFMLYRNEAVYPSDDIPSRLDQIDQANIKEIRAFLDSFVLKEGVTVFIKGTIENPYCKFTKQLISEMNGLGITGVRDFDIFTNEKLRFYMKDINKWQTFPMIYINGDFKGGLDSFRELIASGEIHNLLKS